MPGTGGAESIRTVFGPFRTAFGSFELSGQLVDVFGELSHVFGQLLAIVDGFLLIWTAFRYLERCVADRPYPYVFPFFSRPPEKKT